MRHPGSRDCYREGCRLPQCRAAHTQYMYESRQRRRNRDGDYFIDADAALALVACLKEKGYRSKDLQKALPMSKAGLTRLGKTGTVRRSTLDKLRDVMMKSAHPWFLEWLRGER